MPRLCSTAMAGFTFLSGETCPACGRCFDSALYGNMQGDRAGVSRGHNRRGHYHKVVWKLETSPVNRKTGMVSSRRRANPLVES